MERKPSIWLLAQQKASSTAYPKMLSDILMFSLSLFLTFVLIFILVYFLITLSDLECDYLNATECCSKLNFWNVPKLWLQLGILFMLLIFGHWSIFVLNLPVCAFLVLRFFKIPRGQVGEYDPGEIHYCGRLKQHLIGVAIHLGWQMVGFFVYLYCLLDAVMKEPITMEQDDVEVLNRPAAKELYESKHYDTGGGSDL